MSLILPQVLTEEFPVEEAEIAVVETITEARREELIIAILTRKDSC